jgi:hypothetical protein
VDLARSDLIALQAVLLGAEGVHVFKSVRGVGWQL